MPDLNLGTFDADIAGPPSWGRAWGNASPVWDGAEDNTGNGGGACYIAGDFSADQNTLTVYGCVEGNPWWHPTSANFNMSDYKSLEFDIKWDPNSSLTIAQFNNPPAGGSEGNITFWAVDYPEANKWPALGNVPIPEAAASGWVHVSVPIDPTTSGIDPSKGIVFKKWVAEAQVTQGGTYGFWIDNVLLKGTDAPPPPPTLQLVSGPVPGMAFIAASGGQYDRQNIRTVANTCSWVGAQGPVSYSFDVAKLSDPAHANFQLHMIFVPGTPDPARSDPDWHEPNVLMWRINNLADGAAWSEVRYKTNAPDDNGILWGDGGLGGVWNATPVGRWTITFSEDANILVTTPGGGTLQTNLPPEVVPVFDNTLQVYVGIVPGAPERVGEMAVLTRVQLTGMPGAPDVDSDLLGKPLDTNVWEVVATSAAYGVQEIPTDAAYWVDWTLPALGFDLQKSPAVTGPWSSAALPGYEIAGKHRSLATLRDLPDAGAGFFRLIKREFTKLQVLLPGETAAPGTPTGKTGTPTAQRLYEPFDIVVNAVDDDWNLVSSVSHTVHLATGDEYAALAADAGLIGGTRTFTGSYLGTLGEWTITATDVTDPTKTEGTSSPVTVTE